MTRLSLVLLLFVIIHGLVGSSTEAQYLRGKPITFRNFDYIRAVTSSLNYVYFATTTGIIKYDKTRREWAKPLTGSEGYPDEEKVEQILVDRFDLKLVIVTDAGMYEYEDFFNRWYPISEMPTLENDIRHVSPPSFLLPEFDANYMGDGQFIDYSSRSFVLTDIVDDGAGNLWMGTWGYGPAVADIPSGLMNLLPYGLVQDRVDLIVPEDSVLWLAGQVTNSFRSGLTAFQPEQNHFFSIETNSRLDRQIDDIFSLAIDSHTLYIGSPYGLFFLNRANLIAEGPVDRRHGLADDVVLALELVDSQLYVGTPEGMSVINLATDSIYQVRSETFNRHVVYDLEPVGNTIWIASSVGAYRYTLDTDRLQRFQDPDQVLFSTVLDIEQNGNEVWFASDAGVVRLDLETGAVKSYREPSSLFEARPLAVNDQVVALADDFGLNLIIRDGNKEPVLSFDAGDGLASNQVLALQLDGDYLWVGTDRGLTRLTWNDPLILD